MALLYNAPRAATIRAKTDCVLWALDRECFNNIVKDAAMKKREKNESTLKKVDLLSTVDSFEIGQIADALKSKKVSAGETIIKEGDEGNEFYILEEGKAYATKAGGKGKKPQRVFDYTDGGYFGELALLNNAPRAASIIAETDCNLVYLDRSAFKRLLGPLEDLLKRNTDKYSKYVKGKKAKK
ncbi:MAG: cyclic nucleotide-binding domain-containing protein [archaeon]|nr:cyclic nucleotide-binding domain-containing protein [archaeon]